MSSECSLIMLIIVQLQQKFLKESLGNALLAARMGLVTANIFVVSFAMLTMADEVTSVCFRLRIYILSCLTAPRFQVFSSVLVHAYYSCERMITTENLGSRKCVREEIQLQFDVLL